MSITDFDESEKVVSTTDTLGGTQEVTFLTEKGLYLNHGECPLLYRNGVGQYDAQGKIVRVHACKYDCIRTLKISDKTLAKALSKNFCYNGFYFKEIGEKLKC